MSWLSSLLCNCRHRALSRGEPETPEPEIKQDTSSDAAPRPLARPVVNASEASAESADPPPKKEERICPITGAIGYCPLAKPPKGTKLPDVMPELKVMFLLVWENDGSKVSVGMYPHMSQHWAALDLPDSSSKQEIKSQFHKLSIKYHPDKNHEDGATERFQTIKEAHQALKDVDGELAFEWDKYPERRQPIMTGPEALKTMGLLGKEAAGTDPIKAQMMQHVVKESTECKVLKYERESFDGDMCTRETWANGLCVDTRNGSNHLIKVYRRIVSLEEPRANADAAPEG